MANYTKHYNLKKPAQGDFYDIGDHNRNADIIDEELHKNAENISGMTTPTFDDSGEVEGIAGFPDFMAKVKNKMNIFGFFRDFTAGMKFILHAGQIVNNCMSDAENLPLAAKQGKVLMDLYTQLNGNFTSSFIGKRNILNDTIITAAGGELFFLEPGIYQVTSEETSIYFPERYGTLCIFKTDHHYGCVIFISAIEGNMYHRHFNTNTVNWHTEWNKCAKF